MANADDPDALVFREKPGGLRNLGCASVVLAFPSIGGVVAVYTAFGMRGAGVAVGVVLLLALAIYAFFNEDSAVTIDARGMRLTHRKWFLGMRGTEKVAWTIPLAKLTAAQEINHHRPGRHGGWQTSLKLHLPGSIVLDAALLGEHTHYRALVAALEKRLGSEFKRFNDFGPLGRKPADEAPPSLR